LKDGSKTISERATRFLPVDMKDRLKSAFNRNSANAAAPENARAESAPDLNAIFNPNPTAPAQANPRPLVGGPRLADASSSATMKNSARQVAQDIEEAEIIVESGTAGAGETLDYSVLLKPDSKRAPRQIEAPQALKTATKEDDRPHSEPEAKYDIAKNGEPVSQKSKSRFFGDFSSTESVRLKVEKRTENRQEVAPIASSGAPNAQPDSAPAEVSVLGAERGAVPVFALDDDHPPELPTNSRHAVTEGVAEPARSEQAHINLLEEYDSMDAKEHESGNGAAGQTDGGTSVAAIVIERNSKFSGQLKFAGAVTINGQVEGELTAERIVVHEGGVVNASVDGNSVVIAGTVKGDIRARDELEILASGVVDGSVTAPAITVRRGGRVEGRCTIGVPRE